MAGRGRSRARRLLAVLLLAPVLELAVAIEIGRRVGTVPTLLALVALSAVGVLVLVRQGRGWMQVLQQAAATGRPPGAGAGGARIATRAGAGILLALPGFVTGLLGALLLLPPVGAAVGRAAARRVARAAGGAGRAGGAVNVVITGEVIDRQNPTQDDPTQDGPDTEDDGPPPAVGPGAAG
jgi:UPF0716 protein FxsA